MNSGIDEEARDRAAGLPPLEEIAGARDEEERPSDHPEPGHAPRDEAGAIHQVAEDQPVSEGNREPWAEQERPVLQGGERDGKIGRVRGVLAQADDSENEDRSPRR